MDEQPITPDPEDEESDLDGCDLEFKEKDITAEDITADEDLPVTEGGVA